VRSPPLIMLTLLLSPVSPSCTTMSKPSFCSPLAVSSKVWIDTVKRGP
jgi:hypothetical protein